MTRRRRGTWSWFLWQHGEILDWIAVALFNLAIVAIVLITISAYR